MLLYCWAGIKKPTYLQALANSTRWNIKFTENVGIFFIEFYREFSKYVQAIQSGVPKNFRAKYSKMKINIISW